jgi:hypothetical protein
MGTPGSASGLEKRADGNTGTALQADSTGPIHGIHMKGSLIEVYRGGIFVGSVTDAFNATATFHGLQCGTMTSRFRNFTARALIDGR